MEYVLSVPSQTSLLTLALANDVMTIVSIALTGCKCLGASRHTGKLAVPRYDYRTGAHPAKIHSIPYWPRCT